MSYVYLAEHVSDGTRVIVKELKDQFHLNQQVIDRFMREAEILQDLRHRHLARVFGCARRDGKYYIVQEYLAGGSLADLLSTNAPYSEQEAIRWCCDALRVMNYAHENGIVHRDLKPSNLMLDDKRRVRVIDFGIARAYGQERLTRTSDGSLGTLEYMSPEQILTPNKVDHLTDVYSMGIVLYELLTRTVPFEGATPYSIQQKITQTAPPALRQLGNGVAPINPRTSGIAPRLAKIILRALEKQPEARFGGCAEFALHLEGYLAAQSRPSLFARTMKSAGAAAGRLRPQRPAYAVAGLVIVLGTAAGAWWFLVGRPDATALALVVQANPDQVPASGGQVTYRYLVTNSGNVALQNVRVVDEALQPQLRSGDLDGDNALDVGEAWLYEAIATIGPRRSGEPDTLVRRPFVVADRAVSEPYVVTVRADNAGDAERREADEQARLKADEQRRREAQAGSEAEKEAARRKAADEERRRQDQAKAAEEEKRRQDLAKAAEEEKRRQDLAKAAEEEKRRQDQAKTAEEEKRRQDLAKAAEEEKRRQDLAKTADEEKRRQDLARAADEEKRRQEQARLADEKRRQPPTVDTAPRRFAAAVRGAWTHTEEQRDDSSRTRTTRVLTIDAECAGVLEETVTIQLRGFSGWRKEGEDQKSSQRFQCDGTGQLRGQVSGRLVQQGAVLVLNNMQFQRR